MQSSWRAGSAPRAERRCAARSATCGPQRVRHPAANDAGGDVMAALSGGHAARHWTLGSIWSNIARVVQIDVVEEAQEQFAFREAWWRANRDARDLFDVIGLSTGVPR